MPEPSMRQGRFALLPRRSALAGLLLLLVLLPSVLLAEAPRQQTEIPASYQPMAQNEHFELFVDEATLAFKLRDLRSGYVWHSGLDAVQDGDRLNRSWQALALSGITIEYFDAKAVSNRTSLTNAEHTVTITPIDQGLSAQVEFTEFGIGVEVILQLEASGLRVELPISGIQETNPDYRLGQVTVYPFLGATRGSEIPGYMLLPDGTGSTVAFADSTRAQNMFYGRYYGPDLGILAVQPYEPRVNEVIPISYPVFGMVHGEGENAFLSIVERGAAYGELQAHPAGIITNFNFLYNSFIYNESYFQATNRSGAGITVVQRQTNQFDAVIHFRFLTGVDASVVGMAQDYQQFLLDSGELVPFDGSSADIGIHLEFLGGDKEPALLWSRFVPMTSVPQMQSILTELALPNPEVVFYGWQPFGATSVPPTNLTIEGALGTLDDLSALSQQVEAEGGHLSLYYDPLAALWNEPGYSARNDLAMAITDVAIEAYHRFYTHYFTYDVLDHRFRALTSDIASRLNLGLALDGIGWQTFGDFRQGHERNREATIEAYRALLSQSPLRLTFYRPNNYLYSLAESYFDMPLGDNGYLFTTEAVPFLPIVLAGYVPYYGPALNFTSDRTSDLLRQVEYGIYPSYFVTSEPTSTMLNTASSWIYSSSYAQWGGEIRETYAWMNALLGPVRGQEILAHTALADGVFATTYANGLQTIVNYTDQPYTANGVTVDAKNAVLTEANP